MSRRTPLVEAGAANMESDTLLWEHRETKLHTRARPPIPSEHTKTVRKPWDIKSMDRKSTKDDGDKNERL